MTETNRVWRLRKRPVGDITDDVLSLENEAIPEPGEGEILFRLNYLSLDPTNRIWMSDMEQYMEPVALDAPMRGVVCGTVIKSNTPEFKEGDIVSGIGTWADYQIGSSASVGLLGDTGDVPVIDAFGTLALVGPTAYFCLLDIGDPKPGETVVVSTAAGAVGALVGQIAKIKGCRAVGLTGSDEKCQWITEELGYDVAINYKTQDVGKALAEACPNGIDVYYDNVGGKILDECLKLMNLHGRIPTCGLISQYNATEPVPGPYNYDLILMHRLKIQGFIILDYMDRYPEALEALSGWMKEGKLKARLDVTDGLENALQAVKKLYTGDNMGKLMVRVKDV
ncbi:NADP-dependent oxidoreductase [Porticoccus litoralis]|jgi:NADPH-dependent curcumin reductase CurA|uniref:NADP-dependent oxidoreductase n=1 Tax=Porticoccus litoralis TaxID=434086 RepID=A0AAW8B5H0_9GAMM|nr:NADP-dependent oxidoreductase [Porticoccus litoralis]MDP1520977.1 NADP-dependent oxidoreductase [Porticoccus litoralis]